MFDLSTDDEFEWDGDDEELDPVPYPMKQSKKIIATVDCETDPFAPDFLVKPFCIGFRTDVSYIEFWGDDCVDQFFAYLATCEERFIIYAHNGGKFDFFFFLAYLEKATSPRIINGRLVQVFFGKQEFRDSYAIVDIPLAKFSKEKIDYAKFVPELRERYKPEILLYLKSDCDNLYQLVTEFHARFGDKLTAASAAIHILNSFHGFEKIASEPIDDKFRQYYYGGRVQCFERGLLRGNWKVVDSNSAYPNAMANHLHPISSTYECTDTITPNTDFACIIAHNRGALPARDERGGLTFDIPYGEFFATIHEIKAGIETGTLDIESVKCAWQFDRKTTFAEFVNYYYPLKVNAKITKDILAEIMYKLVLNSSYGKFALNPRKFKEWRLTLGEIPEPQWSENNPDGWSLHTSNGPLYIWERPSPRRRGFYNIATAASITGAARADLLRNIAKSTRPIYCDTDSIICEDFHGDCDATRLGAWKIEAEGNLAAIAGKKLYAIFDNGKILKKASKGCQLTGEEIIEICNGNEIYYRNPVPAFSFKKRNVNSVEMDNGGFATFINRTIRMTGKELGK